MKAKWILLLLPLLLGGCGYHLRGDVVVPEKFAAIHVEATEEIRYELNRYLDTGGVATDKGAKESDAVLSVFGGGFKRRVLTVESDSGKVNEFELVYSADFSLKQEDGTPVIKTKRIRLSRDYVYDVNAVIGNEREVALLKKEMLKDAAQQILRQVRSAVEG